MMKIIIYDIETSKNSLIINNAAYCHFDANKNTLFYQINSTGNIVLLRQLTDTEEFQVYSG